MDKDYRELKSRKRVYLHWQFASRLIDDTISYFTETVCIIHIKEIKVRPTDIYHRYGAQTIDYDLFVIKHPDSIPDWQIHPAYIDRIPGINDYGNLVRRLGGCVEIAN